MYHEDTGRWWDDEPPPDPSDRFLPGPGREVDRLTHLVLVDGRLVETWSEPVRGTRWQRYADRFDAERRPVLPEPPPPPPPPPWEQVLAWLGDVCGGQDAVRALTTGPLEDDGSLLPTEADAESRGRLEQSADLLADVAERLLDGRPDGELAVALRRALLRLWQDDPETVRRARTAAHLAGGLCWALGKANGCFRPQGEVTMARVQEGLALPVAISGYGTNVRVALVGFRQVGHHGGYGGYGTWGHLRRPEGVPDLLALGHADLLTSATRTWLVRLRDRALAARAEAEAA